MRPETCRKLKIILGLFFSTISGGYIYGHLYGMIKEAETWLGDIDVNWIMFAQNFGGVAGLLVAALISEKFGRKLTIAILTPPIIVHCIMLYFAEHFIVILIAKIIVGVSFGGVFAMICISTAEYINPNNRACCVLLMSSVGPAVGGAIQALLCTIVHWRVLALCGIIPTALAAILPYFWIESPSWLASKGRFEECEDAFKMLNGPSALAELQLLISVEKRKQCQSSNGSVSISRKLLTATKQKYFWKLALLSCVLSVLYCACSKEQMDIYVFLSKGKTFGRQVPLFRIMLASSQILGCCLAPLVLKMWCLRKLLMPSVVLGNICLIVLSVCIFINSESVYIPWINCSMIILYTLIITMIIYPIIQILGNEIYPLDIKCHCVFIFGTMIKVGMYVTIRLQFYLIDSIGYHGMFLLNAAFRFLCLLYLWFYLPETKGKKLQEIELHFKNENCNNILLELKAKDQEC